MPFIDPTTTPLDRPMDTTRHTGVSKVVQQSIPNFILDEYPLFVEFLEAYYEWLDQKGNPVEFLQDGNRYFDVDTTTDEFLQYFKNSFLDSFPKKMAISNGKPFDERTLVKNIREFYKMKGCEKSIRLLFKLVADSDSVIEYPRDYIFSLSSGNYKDYHKIHVLKDYSNIGRGFDPTSLHGIQINQYEGLTELTATATIDHAYETSQNGKEYYVLRVTNPSGTFIESDYSPILLTQGNTAHQLYAVSSAIGINIVNGGSGYSVGEFFKIGSTGSGYIKGFVSETDEIGKIKRVILLSNPIEYSGPDSTTFESPFGTGGQLSVLHGVLSEPIQEYKDNKNLLSKVSKIQDSFEYQQFSYVVKSKRSLDEYIEAIKNVIHPSGFVLFNSLHQNIYTIRPTEYSTRILGYENTSIGSYARFTLASNTGGVILTGWNPYKGAGDPNPRKTWGSVFNVWNDEAPQSLIPPTSGQRSLPSQGGQPAIYQTGQFAPTQTTLPNPSQSQVEGITVFIAMAHPAVRGMETVPSGTALRSIKLVELLRMPVPIIGDI